MSTGQTEGPARTCDTGGASSSLRGLLPFSAGRPVPERLGERLCERRSVVVPGLVRLFLGAAGRRLARGLPVRGLAAVALLG